MRALIGSGILTKLIVIPIQQWNIPLDYFTKIRIILILNSFHSPCIKYFQAKTLIRHYLKDRRVILNGMSNNNGQPASAHKRLVLRTTSFNWLAKIWVTALAPYCSNAA